MKPLYIKLLSVVLISSLGIIVYSNTFLCSFHFDDFRFIVDNPAIKNIRNLHNIWGFYPCRFIAFLSFALNYHCHQLHVIGYHCVNLGVHLSSAILLWWLALLTLSTPTMKENKITQNAHLIALLTGLVFVSHPLQTEAVTFIWQRTASMATMFYLASLCLYVKFRHCEERSDEAISKRINSVEIASLPPVARNDRRKLYYIGSLIAAILATFTKETAITLPLMILLYEFTFFNSNKHFPWKSLTPFLLTLFIIPITMSLTKSTQSISAQEVQHAIAGTTEISPYHYMLTQIRVMVTYIRLCFLPVHQTFDYDYPIYNNISEFPVLISAVVLTTILFCAIRLFSTYRLVSFSIFWFFLTLLPELGSFVLNDVIVEHRLYLPLAGYSMFLVSGTYYLLSKNNIKLMIRILMIIIACNALLTFQRNKVWKDTFTLWDDAVRKSPHKVRPYINRGLEYFHQGKLTQAIADFNTAININPIAAEAYNDRGVLYAVEGHLGLAIADFNKAIDINPNYADAYKNRSISSDQLKEYDKTK